MSSATLLAADVIRLGSMKRLARAGIKGTGDN